MLSFIYVDMKEKYTHQITKNNVVQSFGRKKCATTGSEKAIITATKLLLSEK